VLARIRKRDDLRDDDFRYRVAHIALKLQRIAHYMKSCAHRLNMRRVHGVSLVGSVGWLETVDSEMGHEPLSRP
jgi:hypothetical protein